MRVLQVVHALPAAGLGGTELYTKHLAETLAGADGNGPPKAQDVAIATPRGSDTAVAGTDVYPLPDPATWIDPTGQESGLDCGVVHETVDRRFGEVLDEFDPDVVHCQHLKFTSASLPRLCADRGVPCLLTLHDFWTVCHREQLYRPAGTRCDGPDSVEKCTTCYVDASLREDGSSADGNLDAIHGTSTVRDPYRRAVETRTERLDAAREAAELLIAPSRFLRNRFIRFGTSPERIVHRRNGIRVDRFPDTEFDPAGPLELGYAGRITRRKGVHVLLAAVEQLDGDAELDVFGRFDPDDDPYHAMLRERADDGVQFHGRYEATEPYETADVLVVPSLWYENSPLVIQEAFASGIPVIAGNVGGMAELVTDGVDGLTFAVGDPDSLAATLRRVVRSPGTIQRLRRGVDSPKSLTEHADELIDLYETVRAGEVNAAT